MGQEPARKAKVQVITIGEVWLSSELFAQDFDLLQEVINDELLVSTHPASQVEQTEL